MTSDVELLQNYARNKSEESFTEIVRRHVDLVHSAALRQVRSPQLAEEVAQSVFTDLARDAARLVPDTLLSAWLYQVTRRTAIDVVRREARRQLREQIATEMNVMNATADGWTHIEPLLDDAMEVLDEKDRAAVLLRYFENKPLREVGAILGTSDDAAQKRVSRAVERLREFFAKRGVTVGASGLAVVISANAVQAAPVGLAVTISTAAALAGTTLAATATTTVTKSIAMITLQKTIIGATIVAAIGTAIYEARQASTLRNQLQIFQAQQSERIQRLQSEGEEAVDKLAALRSENERLRQEHSELLRLRGDVTRLRKELKTAEQGSNNTLAAQNLQPLIDQAPTNAPPVETYSATTQAVVPWGMAVVTGGWKTSSGKRTFVFAVPKRGDDATQLEIQTRVVEFPDEAVTKCGLNQFDASGKEAKGGGILASDQYETLMKVASDSEGVTLLSAPSVTTLSGRQAQIQVVDIMTTPAGDNYSVGPVVDFFPTISTDGKSVELKIVANLNYRSPSTSQ